VATTGTSAMAMVSTTVRNCRAESIPGDLSGIAGAMSAASGTFNGGGCLSSGEGLFVGWGSKLTGNDAALGGAVQVELIKPTL